MFTQITDTEFNFFWNLLLKQSQFITKSTRKLLQIIKYAAKTIILVENFW